MNFLRTNRIEQNGQNFVAVSAFLRVAIMSILIKVNQNDIMMKENLDFKFYFSYLLVPLCRNYQNLSFQGQFSLWTKKITVSTKYFHSIF